VKSISFLTVLLSIFPATLTEVEANRFVKFSASLKLLSLLANATIPVLLPVVLVNISVAPRDIEALFKDADWLTPTPTPKPKDEPCCS
jgi:hypothetical protein